MSRTIVLDDSLEPTQKLASLPATEQLIHLGLREIEAQSTLPPSLVRLDAGNGLLMAAHVAYQCHYPLRLRPDDIWLCIAQGAARHILNHSEQLRDYLVDHQGRLELEVRRDDFVLGSPDNDWGGVVEEFSEKIGEHLGTVRDLFVSDFTTTDMISRLASEIVLMEAMQKYFVYVVNTLCGIPKVILEGTVEDWQDVRIRAEFLAELKLGWWLDALLPILERIEKSAAGEGQASFWREMYKIQDGSGGMHVSGWVQWLFPYLGDEVDEADDDPESGRHAQAFAQRREVADDLWQCPKPSDFPLGLSRAPVRWEYHGQPLSMELVAGFAGVQQHEHDQSVAPVHFWAMTHKRGNGRCFAIDSFSSPERGLSLKLVDDAGLEDFVGIEDDLPDYERLFLTIWRSENLRSLKGLEHLRGLKALSFLGEHGVVDIDALAEGFTKLERLDIDLDGELAEFGGRYSGREEIEALQRRLREELDD